jgi:putative flippase GtrA
MNIVSKGRTYALRYSRGMKFVFCGGIAATLNLAILYVLTEYFLIWYLYSACISFMASWVVSFLLQKFFTFEHSRTDEVWGEAALYIGWSLVALSLNTLLVYFFAEGLGVWYIFSQVLAGIFVAFWNYFVYSRVIFINRTVSATLASFFEKWPSASLALLYIVANVLMVTNQGLMWDSWLWFGLTDERNHAAIFNALGTDAKLYHLYYLYAFLAETGYMALGAKILAFVSWLLAGITLYRILARYFSLPSVHAWVISAFYLLIPVFVVKFETALILYSVCNLAFYVAVYCYFLFRETSARWLKYTYAAVALVLAAIAFLTSSFLLFYLACLAVLCLYETRTLSPHALMRWGAAHAALVLFPFIFFIVQRIALGAPSGSYVDHNVVTLFSPDYGLGTVVSMWVRDVWHYVAYGLFFPVLSSIEVLQRKIFFIIFALLLLPVTLIVSSVWKEEAWQSKAVPTQWYLYAFSLLFLGAIGAYVLVGKGAHPFGHGFGMRNALLLPLPVAIFWFCVLRGFIAANVQKAAVIALCAVAITFTTYTHYAVDMDWYKQIAIVNELEKLQQLESYTAVVFDDKTRLYNWRNRPVINHEYNGYLSLAAIDGVEGMDPERYLSYKAVKNPDPASVAGVVIYTEGNIEPRVANWLKVKSAQLAGTTGEFHARIEEVLKFRVALRVVDDSLLDPGMSR